MLTVPVPSAFIVQICKTPPGLHSNAIIAPSGDQAIELVFPGPVAKCR